MRKLSLSSSLSQPPGADGPPAKATLFCNKEELKRGPWTPEEDKLLVDYVKREGEGRWRTLPKKAGLLRCGKSCRLRWKNYLQPSIKRGQISPDEEDLILRLHRLLGNRWSLIAGRIPGRTDNEIKNYWNSHMSKKLINQGIDPRTHKPLINPNPTKKTSSPKTNTDMDPIPGYFLFSSFQSTIIGHQIGNVQENVNAQCGEKIVNAHCSDGTGKELVRSIKGKMTKEEDDDADYCTEDMISSFLDSLINDDMFINNQQPHMIMPASDPLTSSSQETASGAMWDASSMQYPTIDRIKDLSKLNE